MKILFLHEVADPTLGGGGEVIIWEQMRGLRDAGHTCVLLATAPERGLRCRQHDGITVWTAGIRNVYWPFDRVRPRPLLRLLWHALDSYNPWMSSYIRQVVLTERPDVASLHGLAGWSAASWQILHRLGIPIVQVLHGASAICPRGTMHKQKRNCQRQCVTCRFFRLPHRVLSRQVCGVVGVSQFILNRHQKLGYFSNVPIQRVIHNTRAPRSLGLDMRSVSTSKKGLRFGYMGRLDVTKGIELLLNAFLSVDFQSAELWIAGHGKQDYERQLRRRFNDGRIHFMGHVRPHDFFHAVDVVVVPSLWNDTLPGVVFEALAFGKPVVASKRGGIPEMITDGENGLLFEPDDPENLKMLLQRLHSEESLRTTLAAGAKHSAPPFLDTAGWCSTYEELYREVVDAATCGAHQ